MARDTREPQSYGSGEDWVPGRTGQRVNDPKAEPEPEHAELYDERRESDRRDSNQGGHLSDFQRADGAEPSDYVSDPYTPVQKVTTRDGGAKRDSFFRKRDYE
jgi:hypothetical protein